MSRHGTFVAGVLVAGLLPASVTLCRGVNAILKPVGQKPVPVVRDATYQKVLDLLFPREYPDASKTAYLLVLRFHPSFQPSTQINVRRTTTGCEVTEYLAEGNVYTKLNGLLAAGRAEDATELAKQLKVTRRSLDVPYVRVKEWRDGFFAVLPRSCDLLEEMSKEFDRTGNQTAYLDGTVYQLWYEQGFNRLEFRIEDMELTASDGEPQLAQWMNSVRKSLAKFPAKSETRAESSTPE